MTVQTTQKITPFLWFQDGCEEAVKYYTSVFQNAKILHMQYYPEGATEGPMKGMEGKVLTAVFELEGQRFMALDGGPVFKFSGAISFLIDCETQEEIDHLWEKLSAVPEAEQCGWCVDKFGVTWQINPSVLGPMLSDPDKEKAGRAMQAMLQMKKMNIAELQKAFKGEA